MLEAHTATVRGKRMSFYRVDNGRPELVLLHGWPVPKEMFCQAIPILAERFNILAPDLPGFGSSSQLDETHNYAAMARAVAGLMRTLNIARANFSGVSMGSRGALEMAYYFPHRVDKLSIQAPTVHHLDEMLDVERQMLHKVEANPILMRGLYWTMKLWPDQFARISLRATLDKANPGYQPIVKGARHSSLRGPYEMLQEFVYTSISRRLPEITAPTHVFVGESDAKFIPPSKKVAKLVPSGRLTIHPGTHWTSVEDPKLFAQLVMDGFQ